MRGIIAGSFDLMHTGHILMLRDAKLNCDHLTIALQYDPSIQRKLKNKPIQSLYERYIAVKTSKYVDDVIPYETEEELEIILHYGHFDVRFLGSDYINNEYSITGHNIVPIKYLKRDHYYSSSGLRERIKKS